MSEPNSTTSTHHEEDIHPSRFLFLPVYRQQCRHGLRSCVYVKFTISAKGKAGGFSILKSLHPSADAEAIRAVKKLPGKWKPALDSKGKPVSCNFVLPINFRLN